MRNPVETALRYEDIGPGEAAEFLEAWAKVARKLTV